VLALSALAGRRLAPAFGGEATADPKTGGRRKPA
jgi:hypothetical protein